MSSKGSKSSKSPKNNKISEITLLSREKAKNLYDIFMAEFKDEVLENNCILLNRIQPIIGDALKREGFESAKKALFLSAPDYFICGFFEKGENENKKTYPAICVLGYDMPANFVPENKNEIISDYSCIPTLLKNTYKYNAIPVSEAVLFLRKHHVHFDDIHTLISSLDTDMSFELSYSGMNGKKEEEYLVLRPTLEIPKEVYDKIVFIAKVYFADTDEIVNNTISSVLANMGVNYRDYKYTDVTAFLKQFTDIFEIIATEAEYVKKYNIKIKILHKNLKNHKLSPQFRSDLPPRVLPFEFDNYRTNLFNLYKKGKYDELTTTSCITNATKKLYDYELWNILINSYLKTTAYFDIDEYSLTDWEKAVFVFDKEKLKALLSDNDFVIKENLLDKKEELLKKLEEAQSSVTTMNTIGTRMKEFLPKSSLLPAIIFGIGTQIAKTDNKRACFKSLCFEYIERDMRDKLFKLFDEYIMYCTEASASNIFAYCLQNGKTALIPKLFSCLSEENQKNSEVYMYYIISRALTEEFCESLCRQIIDYTEKLAENKRIETALKIFESLFSLKRIKDVCIFANTLILNMNKAHVHPLISKAYEIYIYNKDEIGDYLLKNANENNLDLCAYAEFVFKNGKDNEIWSEKRKEIIEKAKALICENKDDEHDFSFSKKLLLTFSDDAFFLDTYIKKLDEFYDDKIASVRYKEIVIHLSKEGIFGGITILYEKGVLGEFENDYWFNEILIKAFRVKRDYENAILYQIKNLDLITKNNEDYYACLNMLTHDLFESFFVLNIDLSKLTSDEKTVEKLLCYCINVLERTDLVSYQKACVIAYLFVFLKKYTHATFIYSVIKNSSLDISSVENALSKIISEVKEKSAYDSNINDIFKNADNIADIFKYLLTTLRYDSFMELIKIARYFVCLEDFEKEEGKYRVPQEEITGRLNIYKMIIYLCDSAQAWITFSRRTFFKPEGFFAVQFLLVTHFNIEVFALDHCTRDLEHRTSNTLPENLLENVLLLIKKQKKSPAFWQAFESFIKKNHSFENCDESLLREYFTELKKYSPTKTLLRQIFIQSGNIDAFLSVYKNDKGITDPKKIAEADLDDLFNALINLLCKTTDLKLLPNMSSIAKLIELLKGLNLSKNERIILLWIDELYEKRAMGNNATNFFEVTSGLIGYYPQCPKKSPFSVKWDNKEDALKLKERFKNHLNLLNRWIELYPTYYNARGLNDFYMHLDLSETEEERQSFFKYIANAVWVMYDDTKENADLLRDCKNLLCVYCLTNCNNDTDVYNKLKDFINDELSKLKDTKSKNSILKYAKALDSLWKSGLPHYIRDKIVCASMKYFWDDVIYDFLNKKLDISCFDDLDLKEFMDGIEQRFFNRRVLQMYIYAKIVAYNTQACEESEKIPETYRNFYEELSEVGEFNSNNKEYYDILLKLSDISKNSIKEIAQYIDTLENDDLKSFLIICADMLENRLIEKTINALLEALPTVHSNILIKLLFSVQNASEIIEKTHTLIEQNSINFKDALKVLIEDKEFEVFLGKEWILYFKALNLYINNYADDALSLISNESYENAPSDVLSRIEALKNAITNNIPLTKNFNSDIPRLSFMQNEYSDDDFNDLLIQFESDNPTYLTKDYISFARQIYYHLMHSEEKMNTYFDYVIKWGFLEEENSLNISSKIDILIEILDYASKSDEYRPYEEVFFQKLSRILNMAKFSSFDMYFDKLYYLSEKICDIYSTNNDSKGIKQIFESLFDLYKLDKMPQNEISSKIGPLLEEAKSLKTAYISNEIIDIGIEIITEYKNAFEQKGRLEIDILNVDDLSDGSVFYTIKNAGKCAVDKISISSFIFKKDDNAYEDEILIKSHNIDNALYCEQVLAFEDVIGDFTKNIGEGESFKVKIKASYLCDGEAGTPSEEEKILYKKEETYTYHRIPYSSIMQREEFENIYLTTRDNSFVLLYGTNGTGKTSIMTMLKDRFNETKKDTCDKVFFPVYITTNDFDKTTHDIVDTILNKICYSKENCLSGETIYGQLEKFLRHKVRRNELSQTDMDELLEDYQRTVSYETLLGKEFTILTLKDVLKNIEEIFRDFDDRLKFSIVILWDAFETVISSKNLTKKQHFKDLIDSFLKGSGDERKIIHIVFAGSNKLLEVVKVKSENQDDWNYMFRDISYAAKKIGNLSYDDFKKIINNPAVLNNGEIEFTPAALSYLYSYTKGHANYSSLFATETLEVLDGKKRKWIYPSDINISDFTTTKNLTEQIFHDIASDSAVISVGKIMAEIVISQRRDIYRSEIITKVSSMRNLSEFEINRALEILHARDFIYETIKNDTDTAYRFTSDIYITNFLARSIKEEKSKETKTVDSDFDVDSAIVNLLKLDNSMWYHLLTKHADANKMSALKQPITSAFRDCNVPLEEKGTTINVKGDMNQQNININNIRIENISNSVLSLMDMASKGASMLTDMGEIEKCLSDFPKLQLKSPSNDEPYIIEDELSAFNTEEYAHDLEDGVKQALLKSDTAKAKTLDEWAKINEEKLKNNGIDIDYIYSLSPQTRDGIFTALYLDELFETLFNSAPEENSNSIIDYAPVTVMLCKALERILKSYHLPLYQDRTVWLNDVNAFNPISRTQGAVIKFTHATLGTFTTALSSMFDISHDFDPQADEKSENMESFLSNTNADKESWSKYMGDLLRLKEIRNKTAHIEPVSKTECKKTIRILFKNGILKKSVDYIKK